MEEQVRARIDRLREDARLYWVNNDAFFYYFFRHFDAHPEGSLLSRFGEAFYDAFSRLVPTIGDDELIVGNFSSPLPNEERAEWEAIYRPRAEQEAHRMREGQNSHMAIDYELFLSQGITGIIDRIDGYLGSCLPEKRDFYLSCRRCLEGVLVYAASYADAAGELADKTADPNRREELKRLAEVCRHVPAEPARDFYEAVQSVHFITHCLSVHPFYFGPGCALQYQLGHPDRYLLPYYIKDLEEGRLTRDEAQLLLDCLGIQINKRVPNGLSSGYMVGGRDKNGALVENDLTMMCMQVIDDIRLVYPSVGFCYAEGMDERYLDAACRILLRGRSHPAIFNDDLITKGLMSYGVPETEAREYIHSTCVEITPVASSNVWVASPYTNMAGLSLEVMDREYDDFDDLLAAALGRLDEAIKANFDEQVRLRRKRADVSVSPLLSCFVHDCLESGVDIESGGARYNWIMPSFVGTANLVDSLYAVKTLVFDKKELSIADFRRILEADFEGQEALRQRILNRIDKYGNDVDEIDRYYGVITDHLVEECKKYTPVFQNGRLIPSVFCWVMHDYFGRETGATPDGRKAGFPLGDGSGPCQGREMKGPTASILSSTKWDHHELIGGVAVNMKFSQSSLGPDSAAALKNLILVYMKRGGFELQINVVDKETLENAIRTPEDYRDLVVRIGGYSDYFVTLSPEMQQEILLRTAHEL